MTLSTLSSYNNVTITFRYSCGELDQSYNINKIFNGPKTSLIAVSSDPNIKEYFYISNPSYGSYEI